MMWKWKRPAAFLLAAAMIFTMPGVPTFAVKAGASAVHTGLCEHHPEHTKDCGYTEGTKGAACEHEHTEDCYTLVKKCIHEHDESCYPVLEGSVSENTATPSEAEKAQPTACTHECSEESGCITKELSCPHERGKHDESCGYIPATEGTPCGYTCEQCNSQDSGLVPGVSGNAPGECICETRCEKEVANPDCPVCSAEDADLSACKGTEETVCICTDRCSEEMVNLDCPICSAENADFSACLGKEAAALAAFALPQADHTHCVCGKDSDTEVNGHTHSTNTEWKAANSLPNSAGSYYLTQSVSGDWAVPTGEVNLCLNGQTISGSITVGSGAKLTLTDCTGTGKLQGSRSESGVSINGGTFNLYGGTITGFVNGVEIGSHNDIKTGSSFTMYGGEITSNEAGSSAGGGVFLIGTTNSNVTAPSFTMHGGTISNNTAGASDGGGGGVYVGEKCSFTMDGGAITGNTATNGNGGGIYIHFNAGNVSISNATITDNKASATGNTSYGHGSGIYSQRGVTVRNVTITGNNSTYEGGGIYGKGAIALTDATVTGNNRYDVYYDGTESTNPKLTVSGSVKAGYYANYDWKLPILVSGALSEDSVIRVGVREGIKPNAGGSLLIAEPASDVTLRAKNFEADAADCVTSLGDDGKVYLVPCTHEMDDTGYTCSKCHTQFDARVGDSAYYKTLTEAFNAARGSTVTLLRDVTLTGNCSSDTYPATLDLNGKTVSSGRYYIHVGGGNKPNTLTVKDSSKGGGTQALNVKFWVVSNGTLAVDDSYTGDISCVELLTGGALERFGGKIGELALSNAAGGSTSTGYNLKLWNGNTNACTIGRFTDNNKSKSLTVKDLLGTDYAKCELYGENSGTWSVVDKSTKIAELTGYTAYKVQFPECVHQCADDSNPVCSVCHKKLYTKITAQSTDGTTKTAYFTEDSALEHGYAEAIQTLNGWSAAGCTEPTLTLLRDMYAFGTSMPLTGTLTLEGGTHTAKNVTVAENADVTFASGSYRGATIDGTATVKEGVTFTSTVTVNGTLNAKGGTFDGPVEFNGSSIANISGGSFTSDEVHGGVQFLNSSVTGTISGGTFVFAWFYTTKVKLSGGTFTTIKTNGDRKLADLLAEGAAYYSGDSAVSEDNVSSLANVTVKSHEHNGGMDGNGTCSICGKQMAASLTVGGTTSWYTAFATAIEAANAADGEKTITLYQDVNGYADGHSTTYELTRGPVTLATGGKTVTRANLTAKDISLTVTGSNGGFNVTVDGKGAELTVNDGNTELAIVTAQNGGKLSLRNGTFSRVAVKDDGSSASLSGGSYDEITSDTGYVKPYALLAEGYAYKDTKKDKWLPNANSISSKVTVEKAPFAVEKIYPNNDMDYTGNSAFATDGNITLTAVIAPETEGDTYYYWWELFNESTNDWTTIFKNVNTATHTGGQSKTLTISGLPVDKSYQYHIFVQCSNGYNCYSEPFTVTRHQHSWTYTASGATITASCTDTTCTSPNGGSVTIKAPAELTYSGEGKPATVTASSDWQGPAASGITISYIKTGKYGPEMLENGELPTNAGEYTASITVGEATASVTYTIGKATPKAEDFTFTAPTSLTYDGNVKSATVSSAKAGTGDVIVKYYDKDGKEATPKNAGEYTVKIDVTESTNYAAANGLTADGWKFSITKAAAPAAETGSLTITNGTQLTYTYDFKQLLPEAPNGDYGTVRYDLGNRQTAINFTAHGYYLDPEIAEFEGSKLTLVGLYAKDGTATGQIGTVKVNVTTTNYENFQLTLVLNAVNQIKPTPDGEITAAEITYGDALSKSTISGKMKDPDTGKSVNGTFAWTDGTINPNAGDYEADWTFTPAAGYEEYATATGTVTIKVNKATPTFNAPTAQENLTYTGQEQALITAGSVTSGGTMQYSLTENGTYSPDIPTGTDAGAYTVWYRVIGDANHKDTAPASVAVRIGQKPLTITGVTVASKLYDGTTNADITSVTFDNVTLKRGTDYNVTASFDYASVDSGKNVTATVTLMGQAAKNYALEQSSFPTTGSITKAAAPDFTKETALTIVNGYEKTYTVTLPALPTLETPKEYGAPTYELGGITLDGSYYTGGAKVENGKLILPIQKNDVKTTGPVGTVTVVIKSTNYEDITLTVNVNATNKLVPTVTAPTANALTYNGAEQALVTAGKATGGTMLYRLDNSEWSEQLPTAKNAGEYTVWYKVQGDAEYADVAEQSLTVTAAKKAVTVTALDKSAHTGSTAPDLSSPETDKDYKVEGLVGADTLSGTVTLDYAQTPDMSKTGKTTINITGTLSNDNYEITYVPGMLTVSNQPSSGGGDSSSGGSGSGGGSSSGDSDDSDNNDNTNQPEDKPQAPVTGETKPIQPDKNGNAAVDNSSVQSAIDKAKQDAKKNGTTENGIAVTVPITQTAGQTSFNVTIKAQTLDLLVKENVRQFTVATDHLVSVNIGLDTLKQLDSVSAGGDIILRVDKVDALRSTEAKAAIGTRPAYDLSLVYLSGGKETPITSLNGHTISVRLPYTPAKGEQTGNLYAVYVDDAGKVEWITKSSYDASQKAVVFETGHFSIYGIGYKNPAPAFTDITGHWAADNILFVASRGLLSGTSDTTFSPNTGMTRGMFVTALGRLAGINPDSYKTGKFTDVKADAYYAPYVNWAAQTGIVEGVTAITFAPDTNINREQMAVIMANYAKKLDYDLPRTLKAVTFADNANISSWAKDAVRAMQQAGILAGKNGNKFDPKGTATRAEVATVLRRFVEIVIDSQTANGWQQNDSGQWSYYRNGKPVRGWLSDDQKWYWLVKATGMMFAGGWKQIDGKWYYFYPDGTMAVNTTIDGYTIGSDGARK